jgi:hypothetical protein
MGMGLALGRNLKSGSHIRTYMEIEWPDDTESKPPVRPRTNWLGTMVGTTTAVRVGDLPSAHSPRDVMMVLLFVAILVLLGVCLVVFGPLPRVFPELPNGGSYCPHVP